MKTYIAYRLPNKKTVLYFSGNGIWINQLSELLENGIIFHSFLGDQILHIANLQKINSADFKVEYGNETDSQQTKEEYIKSFRQLKTEIESNRFKKIILSRTKKVNTSKNAIAIFEELNQKYTSTFNYIISNSEIGTWMGASPERLLTIAEKNISTMALAGTKSKNTNWTEKEFEEQVLVTDTIVETLKETNCTAIKTNGPTTINAGKIQHLHTEINAKMKHKTDWVKILNALHPTAAVCGIPKKAAQAFIPKLEKYNRKFYTGFIGIITPNNKQFFLN